MLCVGNGTIITGGGEGKVVVRDKHGARLSEVIAAKNAIRCMQVTDSGTVVVAGDDGDVISLGN
jgi:aspartokinase-like uncharacterized kinase